MIKLLGLFAIMISSSMTGVVMAKELKNRKKALKEIQANATYIKSELEFRYSSIEECFKSRGWLFGKAGGYIAELSLSPSDALTKACQEATALKDEDKEIIFNYAKNLQIESIGGQIENIKWLIDSIGTKIREAEQEYQSKSRLYTGGGALTGIGLVILLL